MIYVAISPSGVRSVAIEGRNTMADPALLLWPVIRRELSRLDLAVREEAARLAEDVGNIH